MTKDEKTNIDIAVYALEEGRFYCVDGDGIYVATKPVISLSAERRTISAEIKKKDAYSLRFIPIDVCFEIDDYGSTWAITKRELK